MKRIKGIYLVLSSLALLSACSLTENASSTQSVENTYSGGADTSVSVDASAFSMTTDDGAFEVSDGVYTISKSGVYSLSGTLVGQIFVNVDSSDTGTVELDLSGANISYEGNSPIYVRQAEEVKIKAEKDTVNSITDLRAVETSENENQGNGAIYAKSDLKLVGSGTLNVTGTYNNGVHTTKDLKIKNQTLIVQAPNNAIKGSDSVTIESGTITAYATSGDAIKTSSTDKSSSNKQRGTVTITGGTVNLYAANDGIDAAYDAIVSTGTDEDGNATSPVITIRTSSYATSYTNSKVKKAWGGWGPGGGGAHDEDDHASVNESAKGIKASNSVQVSGGTLDIQAYDDGLHANYGDTFDSGSKGVGDLLISGGNITVLAYDDGLHADRFVRVSGGTIKVSSAYEAVEGNQIFISGGEMDVYGTDDAVNAGNSKTMAGLSPYLEISGGYLFAAVPSSGDVDCIDSNGSISIKGGTTIACGPTMGMASALDADGNVTMSGGTLVLFGGYEKAPSTSLTATTKSGNYGSGKSYTLTFDNGAVQTKNLPNYSYSGVKSWSVLGSLKSVA